MNPQNVLFKSYVWHFLVAQRVNQAYKPPEKTLRDHNFVFSEMLARMFDSKIFTETSYDELAILRPSTN